MTTILDALRNAEININNGGLALFLARQQIHNAIALLEKGYELDQSIDALVDVHGSIEAAPDLRAPVDALRGSRPLVLYFANDRDRDEFVEIARAAQPGLKARNL